MLSRLTLSHAATRAAHAEGDSAQNPIAPLARETFQQQTRQRSREAIREGCFLSGRRTVRWLAAILGVSPMPLRKAVRRLAQEKTLEVLPNRTTRAFAQSRPVQGTCYRAAGSETPVSGHRASVAGEQPLSGIAHSPAGRRIGPVDRLCSLPPLHGARRGAGATRRRRAKRGEATSSNRPAGAGATSRTIGLQSLRTG
jgi:hypothetical protein